MNSNLTIIISTILGICASLALSSGFSTIICAIGWGICSSTEYCDAGFYLLIANRYSQNEYKICCPQAWESGYIILEQCHSTYKDHCDYFDNWKWGFIGSLIVLVLFGTLSIILFCSCYQIENNISNENNISTNQNISIQLNEIAEEPKVESKINNTNINLLTNVVIPN